MSLSTEQINQIISHINSGEFANAASIIAYKQDTSDIIRDELEENLAKLAQPINSTLIENIIEIYNKYSNSLPQLENALDSLINNGVINQDKDNNKLSQKITKDYKSLTDDQLSAAITRIRTKQNSILSSGKTPDPDLAKELQSLLQEKSARNNYQIKKNIKPQDPSVTTQASSDAIKSWFVLPDKKELESKDDLSVVTGSPTTEVLRKRYMKQMKSHASSLEDYEIPAYSQEDLNAMSADQQYNAKRELLKQKEFVASFKDTSLVLDQDIFVGQIAAASTTDQYPKVEAVRNKENKLLRHYFFSAGRLDIKYDQNKKQHYIEIVGSIPGRIAIIMKRRTASGRIMEGVYDIVEFQDGQAVFYAYSSKGGLSIENINAIKRAAYRASMGLEMPNHAKIGQPKPITQPEILTKTTENEKSASTPEKLEDTPNDNIKQNLYHEENIAPTDSVSLKSDIEKNTEKEFVKKEDKEKEKKETQVSQEILKTKEEDIQDSTTPQLREQLQNSISEGASNYTIEYIAKKIAEAEKKDISTIKNEFGIVSEDAKNTDNKNKKSSDLPVKTKETGIKKAKKEAKKNSKNSDKSINEQLLLALENLKLNNKSIKETHKKILTILNKMNNIFIQDEKEKIIKDNNKNLLKKRAEEIRKSLKE